MTDALVREVEKTIPFEQPSTERNGIDVAVLHWLGAAGQLAPPYWSPARDIWLRTFYIKVDYLKIAVSTFVEKVLAIPLSITARDHSVKAHVALAEELAGAINRNSGFLKGFKNELAKFITAYLTQDNGAFLLIMGRGKADGPIVGPVSGVMHLDSQRCTRTGNPEFPVRYQHQNGKMYALHYTRVLFMSSMPSDDDELYDVGLCAVSRAIDAAQELLDMVTYSQEKLGSRPPRQILYAKQGAQLAELQAAVTHAENKMDAQGLARFARTMLIAPRVGSTAPLELELLDLAKTPDGFNRLDNTMLCVAVLSAAFGLDMRDLAHAFGMTGQTKADAEVQHFKTRGKGAAQFMVDFTEQFTLKVLPESLTAEFDYVDDTQDQQAAAIRKTRAEARQIDLTAETIDTRTAREQMLEEGEITEQQFEALELADGRLQDGMDVLTLFFSLDEELTRLLDLGVDNPIDVAANGMEEMAAAIDEQLLACWQRHDTAPNANIKRKARQAMAALDKLRGMYQPMAEDTQQQAEAEPADPKPVEDTTSEETPVEPKRPPPNGQPVKARTVVQPINAGAPLPPIPSADDIAADAEANVDQAIQSFYGVHPTRYNGLLEAQVNGKKKSLDEWWVKQGDRYTYDGNTYRYRDSKTGRFVTEKTVRSLVGEYEQARAEIAKGIASRLANHKITPADMVVSMREALRDTYVAEYLAGRGGRNAMTQADWGRLGHMLREQYTYLNDFAADVAAGKLSEAQIAARAASYFNSATQAFERGRAAARGLSLPAMPGDGSTECRSNCKCRWEIEETSTEWRATWTQSAAEHCPTCNERAGMWNPLVIQK